MAGDRKSEQGRFEEEIDLEVTFNEFDDEFSEYSERKLDETEENGRKDSKQGEYPNNIFFNDACNLQNETVKTHSVTNGNHAEDVLNMGRSEEGEVFSSSEDEGGEKMDFDEELNNDLKAVSTANFTSGGSNIQGTLETTTFKFLPPDSGEGEGSKIETASQELIKDTVRSVDVTEREILSMESDNSVDDQSWKRHKRARLELESQENSVERKREGKGE